jgi:putative ABC transport system ATP-binding protein
VAQGDKQPSSSVDLAVLRAEKLGRTVSSKILVADVDFAIGTGEILALVGPSGSGKSSLLRLLNRLDEPAGGTVYLKGSTIAKFLRGNYGAGSGWCGSGRFLFPGTVADNLRFGPRQRGEELTEAVLEDLLRGVLLVGFASRDVANLSGGEAQRVSFARTLANSPQVLLLDEPTSALDEHSKREMEEATGAAGDGARTDALCAAD